MATTAKKPGSKNRRNAELAVEATHSTRRARRTPAEIEADEYSKDSETARQARVGSNPAEWRTLDELRKTLGR